MDNMIKVRFSGLIMRNKLKLYMVVYKGKVVPVLN